MTIQENSSVVFLSSVFPPEIFDQIIANSKGPIQYAADALNKSFIEGTGTLIPNITIVNCPFVSSWPKYNKSLFLPRNKNNSYILKNGHSLKITNVRFINLIGYKLFSKYYNVKRLLSDYCKINKDKDNIYIITYTLHSPYSVALLEIKKKYKNVKLITIVPDLPEYMNGKVSLVKRFFIKLNTALLHKAYHGFDAYILLSKYMAEHVCTRDQPWELIEGIYNPSDTPPPRIKKSETSKNVILYTGTLDKRYGIMNLVEAVLLCKTNDIQLEIYGDGEAKRDIIDIAKNDKRIIYGGQLTRSQILAKQVKADLLVNPRTPEGEFTKYSFPSKTMEYLASGTPTLLYRLPGIPEEYFEHCYTIDKLGIAELAKAIDSVFSVDKTERRKKAEKAQSFILREKNPIEQCKKIISLISALDSTNKN